MIDKETQNMINDMLHSALARKSIQKQVARVARVTDVSPGMLYDLVESDNNATHSRVPTLVPQVQFKVGDWVTFEATATDYAVTGTAPTSAGNGG